jgi:hypothetical protein
MKTLPLTVRRVPREVHDTLKRSAKINNRSINGETLTWLARQAGMAKVVTCGEVADILESAHAGLTKQDREQIADGIEEARRRMNAEHLDKR